MTLTLLGHFVYNFRHLPGEVDILSQLWKEYALSDSRYLTDDSFVVCMEAITALFWGPFSFVCAYYIVFRHPLRHPLQLIVSLGQLYGDALYYATAICASRAHDKHFCRPEAFYFGHILSFLTHSGFSFQVC